MATWVVRERKARFGSVEEAARRSGINRITWNRVEYAQKVWDATYTAVNKAFGLKQGGHEAIMDGREPELLDEHDTAESESDTADAIMADREPDTVEVIMSDDLLADDDKTLLVDLYERMRGDDNGGRGRRHA